jgi:hypothetical protein
LGIFRENNARRSGNSCNSLLSKDFCRNNNKNGRFDNGRETKSIWRARCPAFLDFDRRSNTKSTLIDRVTNDLKREALQLPFFIAAEFLANSYISKSEFLQISLPADRSAIHNRLQLKGFFQYSQARNDHFPEKSNLHDAG